MVYKLLRYFLLFLVVSCAGSNGQIDIDPDEPDPMETVNRKIEKFNTVTDGIIITPVTKLYSEVVPTPIKNCVTNFIGNFFTPVSILSYAARKDANNFRISVGRFLMNSTFGIFGLFDVANDAGLKNNDADFDSVFKHYGRKTGAYIVLPVLGPTTARGLGGYVLEFFIPFPYGLYMYTAKYLDARRRIEYDFSAEIDAYATKRRMVFEYENKEDEST